MSAAGRIRSACFVAGTLTIILTFAACGSSRHTATSATTVPASTTVVATTGPPTTGAGQATTVPDCGAGAYEPATLLIICGNPGAMATGVTWAAWSSSSATGMGDVHLTVGGQAVVDRAKLQLSDVVTGDTGPQFSVLTVVWLVTPGPEGHPSAMYRLTVGSA